jgi:prepilin-type N-terminal cleavage/methylation domain-containing protein
VVRENHFGNQPASAEDWTHQQRTITGIQMKSLKTGTMKDNKLHRKGFTLVETMVVVGIIGLLTSISVPALQKARTGSTATALANNFRTYAQAFEIHTLEEGIWPPDANHGVIPDGMEGQLPRFTETTAAGGNWDWEHMAMGVTAGISLRASNADPATLERIDDILDDGNLMTGNFISNGDRVTLILEH